MHRVVLTGGAGAGKTTLVGELARLGFRTVGESARSIIAERLARRESPRPDPETFAREILRRDREKYLAQSQGTEIVFFDRSPLEALAMLQAIAPLAPTDLAAAISEYPFHPTVFILPPWEAIYKTDAERDQTFAEAQLAHGLLVTWYSQCGYQLHEVPRVSVEERARYVLQVLGYEHR